MDYAGAGATVPLLGFGYSLAKGVAKAVAESGLLGVFTGGVTGAAGGIAAADRVRLSVRAAVQTAIEIRKNNTPLGIHLPNGSVLQPILSLSDHADHGHYHGAYHRSRADSAYLAYHAIGPLPVFTQQPCRPEIETRYRERTIRLC